MKKLILNIKSSVLSSLIEMVFNNYEDMEIVKLYSESIPKSDGHERILITDTYDSQVSGYLKDERVEQIIYVGNNVHKGIVCLNPDNCIHLLKEYLLSDQSKYVQSEFEGIGVEVFDDLEVAPTDLYIKLTSKDSERYVKRFSKDESLEGVNFQTYAKKGVSHIFYKSEEKDWLNKKLISSYMSDKFNEPNLDNVGAGLRGAKSVLREFGFSSDSQKLIESVSGRVIDSVQNHRSLNIKDMLSNKGDLYLKKSFLTSFLCAQVLKVLDWSTTAQYHVLVEVSVMCDIFLEDHMLLCNSNTEANGDEFSEKEADLLMTHALSAFELLKDTSCDPMVAQLVREHHGEKSGIGFCDEIPSSMPPLFTVYRICEDFAIELIRSYEARSFNTLQIYENLSKKHSRLKHKEIVGKAFSTILELTKEMSFKKAS